MPSRIATAAAPAAPGVRRRAGTRGMPRAERERLILEVAGPLFAQRGYHLASMDEIAALAGVSKPMLYAYFDSKEGLYVAYIDRTGRRLVERLLASGTGSPEQRLRAPVSEFLAFVAENRDAWIVLFREINSIRPLAEEVAALRTQLAGAVRELLERGGACPPGSIAADALAHAIVGAGESIANWWLAHPEVERDRVVDWYVSLVGAAVASGGAPG